ncbi:MAG: 2OG-Fe(II) oxygenase [Pseudomonas sp.]|uniref:prolyl hydroxylase family protein n=1 Tax=Pseudomonas sp. TaxID=306 RepID=UPI0033984D59
MLKIDHPCQAWTLPDFLTGEECAALIERGEQQGFEEALIQTQNGQILFKGIRNNDRVLFDDPLLAQRLFQHARPHLPEQWGDWALLGFNERFRFYRYQSGQYFKWHRDGSYVRDEQECSQLTFMIYLNDGYEGGLTEFREEKIQPARGTALIFSHGLLHQGSPILSGSKYVLRTDVMYRLRA